MDQYGGGSWAMGGKALTPPPSSSNQQQQQQSLASHFHLSHLVEKVAEIAESGVRDQQSDALVAELSNQFDKCHQLLNSVSASVDSTSTTLHAHKLKLDQSHHLLNNRRDVICKYTESLQQLINPHL